MLKFAILGKLRKVMGLFMTELEGFSEKQLNVVAVSNERFDTDL